MKIERDEITALIDALEARDIPFRTEVSTAELSTLKAGATVAVVAEPESYLSLKQLAEVLEETKCPYFLMGAMSNTLVLTEGFPLAVSARRLKGVEVIGNRVYAGGGESLQNLVTKTAQFGLKGLEVFAGIPASVGGAIFMNAGCYGAEIADFLESVSVFDFDLLRGGHLTREQMEFSYRKSGLLRDRELILGAEFLLTEDTSIAIKARADGYRKRRKETQPSEPSLGCTFLRAGGVSAGYYIDKAGLKGLSVGGMQVSDKHAGFIVNNGGGTAEEYQALMKTVRQRVYEMFGVKLTEETRTV